VAGLGVSDPRRDRKFARFYYDQFIEEFPEIYANDPVAGWTWLRLLVVAEKMWPTTPELPRWVRPRPLGTLVAAGLVEILPDHGFRIRGFDTERAHRAATARNAAAARWTNSASNAPGNANASADAMPRRVRDENETKIPPPPAKRGRRNDATNPRATGDNPRATGDAPRQNGTAPRQVVAAEKRGGLTSLRDITAGIASWKAEREGES
jgi:hypothetical protein